MELTWKSFLLTLSLVLPTTVVVAESTVPTPTEASEETETIVSPESTSVKELPSTHPPETVDEFEVISAEDEREILAEEGTTPEEQVRLEKLIEADQYYQSGQLAEAQRLYQEAKEPFAAEVVAEAQAEPEPISDPAQLSPAGSVYWRQAQAGIQQRLETKVLVPLSLLTQNQPEFIPGQILYAQALRDYNRPEEAVQVLERAVNLYPNEPELLKAQIASYGQEEKWLEASLTARRFALLNPDHPETETFTTLAAVHLDRYQDELREDLQGNAIANIVTGALGYALTGGLLGPISAVQTTAMLLQGESAVGENVTKRVQNQAPMVEDAEIVNYVQEIGTKLVQVSGRDDFDYEFHIIMDDRLNAFALPGGKIFINAGAIMKTDSEAELAGLLAHELAHAVLSHGFQLATEGNLLANLSQYIPYGGTAANLIVLNYSREMEREADELGTRILAASGYAADGLHNLMLKLGEEKRDHPTPPAWLSTHPNTKERITNLQTQIVRAGYNRYTYEGVFHHQAMSEKMTNLWDAYTNSEEYRIRQERQAQAERQRRLQRIQQLERMQRSRWRYR